MSITFTCTLILKWTIKGNILSFDCWLINLYWTLGTQEEAAEAYDIAAIKFRGLNAVTNFDMSRYDVKSIANSNLPIGGMSGKSKNSSDQSLSADSKSLDDRDLSSASSVTFASSSHHQPSNSSTLSFAIPIKQDPSPDYWSNIFGYLPNNNPPSLSNARNPSSVGVAPTYFHGNMDFSATSSTATTTSASETNNGLFFSGGYNVHGQLQQQSTSSGTNNSIPFSTPIALNSNMGYDQSSSSGYGTWIGPSLNLFQTPIFGMEWKLQESHMNVKEIEDKTLSQWQCCTSHGSQQL